MFIQFDYETSKVHDATRLVNEPQIISVEEADREDIEKQREMKEAVDRESAVPQIPRIPLLYRCKVIDIEHLDEIWIFNGLQAKRILVGLKADLNWMRCLVMFIN